MEYQLRSFLTYFFITCFFPKMGELMVIFLIHSRQGRGKNCYHLTEEIIKLKGIHMSVLKWRCPPHLFFYSPLEDGKILLPSDSANCFSLTLIFNYVLMFVQPLLNNFNLSSFSSRFNGLINIINVEINLKTKSFLNLWKQLSV